MDMDPEFGKCGWESVRVTIGRQATSLDVTVELRSPRDHPWPETFDRLTAESRSDGAAWSGLGATPASILVLGVEPGSEEQLRNFIERMVPLADEETDRLEAAASVMAEQFRKLSGFPPC